MFISNTIFFWSLCFFLNLAKTLTIYEFLYILYSGFKFSTSIWEVSHNLQFLNPFFFLLQFLFLVVQYLISCSNPFFFSARPEALVLILPFWKVLWPKGCATFIWNQWSKGTEGKAPFNTGTVFGGGQETLTHPSMSTSSPNPESVWHKQFSA